MKCKKRYNSDKFAVKDNPVCLFGTGFAKWGAV